MTILKIYSLDDTEQKNLIASLGIGDHVVGRGGFLRVTDHRVSRKHAIIAVSHETITLTSIHVNPCFLKKANNNRTTIIRKDAKHELDDDDKFALLPEQYWFRVRIHKDEEPQTNGKRANDGNLNGEEEAKKAKLSTPVNPSEASTSGTNEQSTINIPEQQTSEEPQQKDYNMVITNVMTCAEEPVEKASNNLEPQKDAFGFVVLSVEGGVEDNAQVKQEPSEDEAKIKIEPVDGPTTSAQVATPTASTTPKREKCWYAAACFRKNPNHKDQFSHPGDPDYDSDSDEERPDCPFGENCYRKNPEHRREYKHSQAPKPNTDDTAQSPRKRKAAKKNPSATDDDPDDSYDYDDPFINDASSDDYQPSVGIDSSDTDWEDSQQLDEESQEIKRTLREAKKFTKNKKK